MNFKNLKLPKASIVLRVLIWIFVWMICIFAVFLALPKIYYLGMVVVSSISGKINLPSYEFGRVIGNLTGIIVVIGGIIALAIVAGRWADKRIKK